MPDAVANFLVLLPVDDFAEAYQHAERLWTALERATVPASIGIAYADRTAQQRDPRRLQALAATNREAAKTKGLAIYPKPALSDLAAAPLASISKSAYLRQPQGRTP
jgi:GGDEF domain-containing protein